MEKCVKKKDICFYVQFDGTAGHAAKLVNLHSGIYFKASECKLYVYVIAHGWVQVQSGDYIIIPSTREYLQILSPAEFRSRYQPIN